MNNSSESFSSHQPSVLRLITFSVKSTGRSKSYNCKNHQRGQTTLSQYSKSVHHVTKRDTLNEKKIYFFSFHLFPSFETSAFQVSFPCTLTCQRRHGYAAPTERVAQQLMMDHIKDSKRQM